MPTAKGLLRERHAPQARSRRRPGAHRPAPGEVLRVVVPLGALSRLAQPEFCGILRMVGMYRWACSQGVVLL